MTRKAVSLRVSILWSFAAILLLAVSPIQAAEAPFGVGIIDTFAGVPKPGDGGPATDARLAPYRVTLDGAGNLYIADLSNHRIRKVDAAGTITTVAGTGERGYSGDGGPATEAQINRPTSVTLDGAGNLYIADFSNNRIRKVDAAGTITTVAGDGGARLQRRRRSGDRGPDLLAR